MANAVATVKPVSALAARLELSQEKLDLVRSQIAPGAPDDVLEMYFEQCRVSGFDPFAKMLHLICRNAKQDGAWVKRWTMQTAIDGFRSIAEDSGEYDGQDEPIFAYDNDGRVLSATVRVYRKGMARGVAATAYWSEYVQADRDGAASGLWAKMPRGQLAKCAESLALRKAFPKKLASVYSSDEMAQSHNEAPPTPAFAPMRTDAIDAEFTPAAAIESKLPAPSRAEEARAKVNRATESTRKATQEAAAPAPTPTGADHAKPRLIDLTNRVKRLKDLGSGVGKTGLVKSVLGDKWEPAHGFSDADIAALVAAADSIIAECEADVARMEAESRAVPEGLFAGVDVSDTTPNADETVIYCPDENCGAVLAPARFAEKHSPECKMPVAGMVTP
jgi:phage recombination protein Bet